MVIHFFELRMTHLSLALINNFWTYFGDREQRICVYCESESNLLFGTREDEEKKYIRQFERNNIQNYAFINGKDAIVKTIKEEVLKNNLCVLHGFFPLYDIYKSFGIRVDLLSRIVYVHWGGEEVVNRNFSKFRFWLGFLRKRYSFSKFKCFVVLAETDKLCFKKNYGIKNIVLNSYPPSPKYRDYYMILKRNKKLRVKVMVSHCGHSYCNHIKVFEILKEKYDSVIEEVVCPLCYGEKDYIDEVIRVGQALFGYRFSYFTSLLPKEDYVKYIRDKDVYIAAPNEQSGLFAASMALGNGLKVFCGKSNFENYSSKGFVIYKFDDLDKISIDNLVSPLNEDEIIINNEKLIDSNRVMKIVNKWEEILFGEL